MVTWICQGRDEIGTALLGAGFGEEAGPGITLGFIPASSHPAFWENKSSQSLILIPWVGFYGFNVDPSGI